MGSCLGACFAGMCCTCCGCSCPEVHSGPVSRIPYLFLFVSAGVFSIVMSLYGEEALDLHFYDIQLCSSETCAGLGSVYRTSFILFLFELIHVLMIGAGVVSFHWLFFVWKLLIFIISLTLTFVINEPDSNTVFQEYADYFARYVSALYLILQILILIVWSYDINESILERVNAYDVENRSPDADEDDAPISGFRNPWTWLFVLLTLAFYTVAFTFLGCFCFFRKYTLLQFLLFPKMLGVWNLLILQS